MLQLREKTILEDLTRDGVCVIPDLLDKSRIETLKTAFDSLLQERQSRNGFLAPRETNRFYLTLPFAPPFADPELFANATILELLDEIFQQPYEMVQLAAEVPLQGSDYQELHRDLPPLFGEHFLTPIFAVTVSFPLVDVHEENGPIEIIRGSHKLSREDALRSKPEKFLLKKGDVLLRSPLALHRGTPNRTDEPRPMVVMGYCMHWLHTRHVDITVPREFYGSLPEKVRTMLRCNVVEHLVEKPETYLNFKH